MHRHLKFLPRHEYCSHSLSNFQKGEINYLNRNASPSQVMQRYCSLTEKNVLGKKIKYFTNFTRKINKFKCFENEGLNILQILQEKTNKSKYITISSFAEILQLKGIVHNFFIFGKNSYFG